MNQCGYSSEIPNRAKKKKIIRKRRKKKKKEKKKRSTDCFESDRYRPKFRVSIISVFNFDESKLIEAKVCEMSRWNKFKKQN